ncbi:hypothetical protein BC939DRAFT_494915 [Gamsiella multidivaricata]|uniref:uncharacterized protein n=1 Tax=Gamsiella multidivaricata TaxID=101098 RepID=UPI0022209706|nr:uncharacterized protein BC939DRAFT_494915 [Gamsiella multidivaricata]KAI7819899.1 hypothetical protein BC939DRAFT_494915 [Gamsiella multidivaricata]
MDPLLNCDTNQDLDRMDDHDDDTFVYWRHSCKPATYSEDHLSAMSRRSESLRRSRTWRYKTAVSSAQGPCALLSTTTEQPAEHSIHSNIITSSSKVDSLLPSASHSQSEQGSPSTVTRVEAIPPHQVWPGAARQSEYRSGGSLQSSPAESTASDKSIRPFVSSTIARLCPRRPTSDSLNVKDIQDSNPASSASSSNYNSTFNVKTEDNGNTQDTTTGTTPPSNFDESGSNNPPEVSKTLKDHRPIVPRIIIPDGTSVNLSTPSTTPRQERSTPVRSPTSPWSHNVGQIMERLQLQGRLAFSRNNRSPDRTLQEQQQAIGLTASGKIRDRHQVSDNLPESLADAIMEAQIVVVKDIQQFHQPKLNRRADGDRIRSRSLVDKLQTAAKIPVWIGPVQPDCFDNKCDFDHFGNEYFAFLHPESFGIALPHNWPSLCNSCIDISRNEFLYKTRVRILGDLVSCSSASTSPPPSAINVTSSQFQPIAISVPSSIPSRTEYIPTSTKRLQNATVLPKASSSTKSVTRGPYPTMTHERKLKSSRDEPRLARMPQQRHSHEQSRLPKQQKPRFSGPQHSHGASKGLTEHGVQKRGIGTSPNTPNNTTHGADMVDLPYLIVDPATFSNLTAFETPRTLQNLDLLRVQFRFVLCDS